MAFDFDASLRLIHIAGAALWVGSAIFLKSVVMKNVEAAGPPGKAYMLTVVRNGGWGKFIGPAAVLTILAGLLLYWRLGIHEAAMEGPNAWLTLGLVTGILALTIGLTQVMPAEARMKKIADAIAPGTPPSEEQGAQLAGLAEKASKMSLIATSLAALTFLLMAGRHVF